MSPFIPLDLITMDSEKYEPFHNKSISIIYIKNGIQIEEILEILEGKKPAKL